MSDEALESLVWRGHKPLLGLAEKKPKKFGEEIHKAIESSGRNEPTKKNPPLMNSDIGALHEELIEV